MSKKTETKQAQPRKQFQSYEDIYRETKTDARISIKIPQKL